MYCEDYPCCGHTDLDPCAPQWYDEPDAFDVSVNPHALCEHDVGICDVWEDEEEEEEEEEDDDHYAVAEDAYIDAMEP